MSKYLPVAVPVAPSTPLAPLTLALAVGLAAGGLDFVRQLLWGIFDAIRALFVR